MAWGPSDLDQSREMEEEEEEFFIYIPLQTRQNYLGMHVKTRSHKGCECDESKYEVLECRVDCMVISCVIRYVFREKKRRKKKKERTVSYNRMS